MKIILYTGNLHPPTFIRILSDELVKSGHISLLVGYGQLTPFRKQSTNKLQLISLGNRGNLASEFLQVIRFTAAILLFKPNYIIKYIRSLLSSKDKWRTKLRKLTLYALIIRLKPDIVHLQWASHLKLFEDLIVDKNLVHCPKYIVSLRGRLVNVSPSTHENIANLYKQSFPKVEGFHAVSQAIAHEAQRWGAHQDKIRVIYSGVDVEKISGYRKSTWQLGAPIQMLSVGRYHWIKGYRYALEALCQLTDKGIMVQYTLLAGAAPEEILYNIQSLGLEHCVRLLPNLPQEDVFQLMQESDFLLLPSVEEGIANVVLEAMALGLPVISSNCGGMAEVIEHQKNGLLFENRNVDSLTMQIEYLLSLSNEERRQMTMLAQQTVTKQHGKKRLGKEMLEFYQTVLNNELGKPFPIANIKSAF